MVYLTNCYSIALTYLGIHTFGQTLSTGCGKSLILANMDMPTVGPIISGFYIGCHYSFMHLKHFVAIL